MPHFELQHFSSPDPILNEDYINLPVTYGAFSSTMREVLYRLWCVLIPEMCFLYLTSETIAHVLIKSIKHCLGATSLQQDSGRREYAL